MGALWSHCAAACGGDARRSSRGKRPSGCRAACRGCFSFLLGTEHPAASSAEPDEATARWVWHGGLPMKVTDPFQGGLPGYVGLVNQMEIDLGPMQVHLETWPDYRIGSILWPSGMLLARALAEGLSTLPSVGGRRIAEIGAGPGIPGLVCGKLGASSVTITDRMELVPLIKQNIKLNGVEETCQALSLDWTLAMNSPLATANRGDAAPLDLVLAADVVYFEEQDPLIDALKALMLPGHTELVLAYRQRTLADRMYLDERILPRLDAPRLVRYETAEHGATEIYIGKWAT